MKIIKIFIMLFYSPTIFCRAIGIAYYRFRYEKRTVEAVEYTMARPFVSYEKTAEILEEKLIEMGVDHEDYRKGAIDGVINILKLKHQLMV